MSPLRSKTPARYWCVAGHRVMQFDCDFCRNFVRPVACTNCKRMVEIGKAKRGKGGACLCLSCSMAESKERWRL